MGICPPAIASLANSLTSDRSPCMVIMLSMYAETRSIFPIATFGNRCCGTVKIACAVDAGRPCDAWRIWKSINQ
eukprot:6189534-Pleurochrysis_carterae.AAC.5